MGLMSLISGSEIMRTLFSGDSLEGVPFSDCGTDSECLRIDLGTCGLETLGGGWTSPFLGVSLAGPPGSGVKQGVRSGFRKEKIGLAGLLVRALCLPIASSAACGEPEAPRATTSSASSFLGATRHSPALFLRSRRIFLGELVVGELEMTALFRFGPILLPG
jgi:hypothetical protein